MATKTTKAKAATKAPAKVATKPAPAPAPAAKLAPASDNAPAKEPALEPAPAAPAADAPQEGVVVTLAPLQEVAPVKTGHKRNLLLNTDGTVLHDITVDAHGALQLPAGVVFDMSSGVRLDKRQFDKPLEYVLYKAAQAQHDMAAYRAEAAHMLAQPELHKTFNSGKVAAATARLQEKTALLDSTTEASVALLVDAMGIEPIEARKLLLDKARACAQAK